jgi:transaldolase
MKLFLDTAFVEEIKQVQEWGLLDGVTTNPSHVAKTGRNPKDLYPEICALVDGPVSLEALSLESDGIVKEGRQLAKISDNVVVKVPLLREGLIAVKKLTAEGIKTNVTTTFSPLQALLAAKAGATYVSPFVGRLDYVGHHGMTLVEEIRQIYDNYGYKTQVLVAAIRHPHHVLEAALIGADVCTIYLEYFKQLFEHPMTDISVANFLKDWEKVPK